MLSTLGLEGDTWFLWIGFALLIALLLIFDLAVVHREKRAIQIKESVFWSVFWISISLIFNLFIFIYQGKEPGLQFLTGYLIEKSLSVDNLFVFALIFSYFKIPSEYQYKVLYWGIIGAIVLRFLMIWGGITLIVDFNWLIYVFGAFIFFTGIRFFFQKDSKLKPEKNLLITVLKKFCRITQSFEGGEFFIRRKGFLYATPLAVSLLIIESSDIVFALDSIPAILAITTDPFIVFTSNIFAILGLRSLYFLLAGSLEKFYYLKYGLGLILLFIGAKMILTPVLEIPTGWSLLVVAVILAICIYISFLKGKKRKTKKIKA